MSRSSASEPQPVQHRFNVVLFGNTGAASGRSVINLISGSDHARHALMGSSLSVMDAKRYKATIQGRDFRIIDTPDLDKPRSLHNTDRLITAIGKAYQLARILSGTGGINLLVFCMRAGNVTSDMRDDYRLFHNFFCQAQVPLVLVVTDLEHEPNMEDWWTRNKSYLSENGIRPAGHVCVTTIPQLGDRFHASRKAAHNLLIEHGCGVAFTLDRASWVAEMFLKSLTFIGFYPPLGFLREGEMLLLLGYGLKDVEIAQIMKKICRVDGKMAVPGPSLLTRLGAYGSTRDRGGARLAMKSFTVDKNHDEASLKDLTYDVISKSREPVASGGYADIYDGMLRRPTTAIKVAIKSIKIYSSESKVIVNKKQKRFRRELIVWQGLKHENIVPLLGVTRGFSRFSAMVSPWVVNGTLTSYLKDRYDSLPAVEILRLPDGVSRGLEYLHSRSVVHGDLSGSNILIDENGCACITDFGLSTLLTELGGPTFNTSFHERGSIRWMAPELLDFKVPEDDLEVEVSPVLPMPCSDVYSFGGVMLQILSGKMPYHHCARDLQVVSAISKGIRPTRPNIPIVTDPRWAFIERCWSTVDIDRTRPSSKEIVDFIRDELARASAS